MAYAKKYWSQFSDDFGNVWKAELWQNNLVGWTPEELTAGGVPLTIRWEGEGSKPYEMPIRASSAEFTFVAEDSGVADELELIVDAEEDEYRLYVYKGANLFWRGTVLNDLGGVGFEGLPEVYTLTAVDGLGRLQGIEFSSSGTPYTGRDSKLAVIAKCVNKLGFLLPFLVSDDWYSEDMDQGNDDDPLDQADVDQAIYVDGDGVPLSCYDVLKDILGKKSLQIRQSSGYWVIFQREQYAKDSFIIRYWNSSGVFVSSENWDPRVVFDNDDVRIFRGGGFNRSVPARSVSIEYDHGPVTQPVQNGSFEEWEEVSGEDVPVDWTTNGLVAKGIYGYGNGYSVEMEPDNNYVYGQEIDPDGLLRIESATAEIGVAPGSSQLKFKASALWTLKGMAVDDPDDRPRPCFISLRIGDYCVEEQSDGAFEWVESSADIWLEKQCTAEQWSVYEILTDQIPVTGTLEIKLTTVVENRKVNPAETNIEKVYWDNIEIELVYGDELDENEAIVTTDVVDDASATEDVELDPVLIGDGPTSGHTHRITVGSDSTALWSRSGLTDDLNLDQLNCRMILRSLWKSGRIFRGTVHADMVAHQSLVIDGRNYALNGVSFDAKKGQWSGQWQEQRDEAGSFTNESLSQKRAAQLGGRNEVARVFSQLSNHVGSLMESRAVTTLSANLASGTAYTQISINVIGEHLFDVGDTCIIVNLKNGNPHQVTISQNQGAGDNHLHINSYTPDEDIFEGSAIYQSDKQLLSMIIQNEDAIVLRVQYGEVASQLSIEADSITFDTNIVESNNWDGVVDGSGHITTPGTVGWAITGAGEGEFASLNARGTFVTGVGTKRVEIRASDNEMEFFEGGVSKVRIGSEVEFGDPGIVITDGVIYLYSSVGNGVDIQTIANSSFAIQGQAYGATYAMGIGGIAGGSGNNKAIYGSASGGTANWAGYFDDGNVYVANSLAIGTATAAAKLTVLSTTEQLRLGYDVNNYVKFIVPASGDLLVNPVGSNVFIGSGSGNTTLTGTDNFSLGISNFHSVTTGAGNYAAGRGGLYYLTEGQSNFAMGYYALLNVTTGNYNIGIGNNALQSVTTGVSNVAIGVAAGYSAPAAASGNVFIGYQAGYSETGSSKLYISNSSTNNLIQGDFSTGRVGINVAPLAAFQVQSTTEQIRASYDANNRLTVTVASNGTVTFDAVGAGSGFIFSDDVSFGNVIKISGGSPGVNKVLISDGSGNASWSTTTAITQVGTIASGIWHGSTILAAYIGVLTSANMTGWSGLVDTTASKIMTFSNGVLTGVTP